MTVPIFSHYSELGSGEVAHRYAKSARYVIPRADLDEALRTKAKPPVNGRSVRERLLIWLIGDESALLDKPRVVMFMQGGYTYEIFCRGEEVVRRLNDRLALDGHLRR